jgi:hypothetical protein
VPAIAIWVTFQQAKKIAFEEMGWLESELGNSQSVGRWLRQ